LEECQACEKEYAIESKISKIISIYPICIPEKSNSILTLLDKNQVQTSTKKTLKLCFGVFFVLGLIVKID
jgi:hypothetical protein